MLKFATFFVTLSIYQFNRAQLIIIISLCSILCLFSEPKRMIWGEVVSLSLSGSVSMFKKNKNYTHHGKNKKKKGQKPNVDELSESSNQHIIIRHSFFFLKKTIKVR